MTSDYDQKFNRQTFPNPRPEPSNLEKARKLLTDYPELITRIDELIEQDQYYSPPTYNETR